ncbi:hypothetical protein [Faecalimicrobium sp. JNUCC 81]
MIKIIEKELEKLRKNLKKIKAWEIEIEVLKEKMSAYKDGGFSLAIGSPSVVTIDDILARDETRLNTLESNIDYAKHKLKEYRGYLVLLDDYEFEVLNRRYLDITNNRTSYEKIGKDMCCSHTTAKRWHDSALEKIVEYKFQSVEIA